MSKNEIRDTYRGVEGWDKPDNSKEQHYFIGTRSLCMKWALFSSTLKKEPMSSFLVCEECAKKVSDEKVKRGNVK